MIYLDIAFSYRFDSIMFKFLRQFPAVFRMVVGIVGIVGHAGTAFTFFCCSIRQHLCSTLRDDLAAAELSESAWRERLGTTEMPCDPCDPLRNLETQKHRQGNLRKLYAQNCSELLRIAQNLKSYSFGETDVVMSRCVRS